MVVGMSLYSQIWEAYVSGESIRSIAKRLGISRQTVKKYCEGTTMPGVRKDYLRAPSRERQPTSWNIISVFWNGSLTVYFRQSRFDRLSRKRFLNLGSNYLTGIRIWYVF